MTPMSILIADDDHRLVLALTQRCRQLGLEVLTANDAQTALRIGIDRAPDLVCLDVTMPGGNGLAVREMMAGDERMARIPVIILTGSSDEQTIRRCHDSLAYYVLKGPDIWSHMEPLIRELLSLECTPSP